MKFYFTRHGESEANVLHIISNRDLPHALTEKGRQQAVELAEKLSRRPISRIFSSPISRARQTAEILSEAVEVPVECVEALREPDCGMLEGRRDGAAWKEHSYWQDSWLQCREQDRGPEGGETCDAVRRRFAEFIRSMISLYEGTKAELVVVTHGALIQLGLPFILGDFEQQFSSENCPGYTTLITVELQAGKLVCSMWE